MERRRKFWAEIGRIEMDTVLSTGHYFLFAKTIYPQSVQIMIQSILPRPKAI